MALITALTKQHLFFIRPSSAYLKNCLQPSREFKTALKIKWVRPEKISCIKPEASGDLAPLGTINMKQFPSTHKDSKELQNADELVQRIHTLEFFNRKVLKQEFMTQYANRVKAHQLDDDSPEVKLAGLTAKIRNLQIHIDQKPNDKVNKQKLKIFIDKRNKYLTQLRNSDYKKFEWLLEKLDLQHKVFAFNAHERVERKRSLRRLTMLYIIKLKNERLLEYRNLLESQKEGFLKEKLEKLLWIKTTEEKHGVSPTVSDTDIETVQKQLQDLQLVKPKELIE